VRSIFQRERVTQTVRPCGSRGGNLLSGTRLPSVLLQASKPPSKYLGLNSDMPQVGGDAVAKFLSPLADDLGRFGNCGSLKS
jgi:hypothetical protein